MKYLIVLLLCVPLMGQVVKPLRKPIACNRQPSCWETVWRKWDATSVSSLDAGNVAVSLQDEGQLLIWKRGYAIWIGLGSELIDPNMCISVPGYGLQTCRIGLLLPEDWANKRDVNARTCVFLAENTWQFTCAIYENRPEL